MLITIGLVTILLTGLTALSIPFGDDKAADAADTAELKSASVKALQEHIQSPSVQKGSQLHKRQEVLAKTLAATYYYRCPHGGLDSRYFVWKAVYTIADEGVEMFGLRNIDKWSGVAFEDNAFGAFFYHSYCKEGPARFCTYHFQGWTEGEVYRSGITLDLVQETADSESLPKVTETCILLLPGGPMGTCAAYHATDTKSCTINSIDVHVAH